MNEEQADLFPDPVAREDTPPPAPPKQRAARKMSPKWKRVVKAWARLPYPEMKLALEEIDEIWNKL